MNEEFIKHAKSNGKEGELWLARIPEIIRECESEWQIKVKEPFNLTYNYVAPAIQQDGTEVVLKIGWPNDREFKSEIEALSIFKGEGIERLLKVDKKNWGILIEKVTPGVSLKTVDEDEKATRILASVMKRLWKPVTDNHPFIIIKDWTSELFSVRDWYGGTTGPLPEYFVDKAQSLFNDLIASQDKQMLLHGDLHHDNVLSSHRDGWLAIDPKGVVAEACYETAAMLRNPYPELLKRPNPQRVLQTRIEILSEELGFDRQRILDWGIAQTVLSAVWSCDENGKGWEYEMAVAEQLDKIKFN